jgi:hypothetical protein
VTIMKPYLIILLRRAFLECQFRLENVKKVDSTASIIEARISCPATNDRVPPLRLPRVKTLVLPAVSAPSFALFCEGWESRPQPAEARRSTKVVLVISLPGWINVHLCDALH